MQDRALLMVFGGTPPDMRVTIPEQRMALRWWQYLYVVPLMPLFMLVLYVVLRGWRR